MPVLAALTQFAVGGLWAQTLVPLAAIGRGFFAVCSVSLLAAQAVVLWVLGTGTGKGAFPAPSLLAVHPGPLLLGAALFAAALLAYLLSLGLVGEGGVRLARRVALLLGGGLLVMGTWGEEGALGAMRFPLHLGNAFLGAALLGLAFVGMLLGHSYLNAPHLPLRLMERLSRVFLWTVLARGVYPVLVGALFWIAGSPALAGAREHLLLLLLRLGVGVGGSLTVALIILNCLRLPNVQAATGFYYVAILTVFLGEVLGRFLLVLAHLPL